MTEAALVEFQLIEVMTAVCVTTSIIVALTVGVLIIRRVLK